MDDTTLPQDDPRFVPSIKDGTVSLKATASSSVPRLAAAISAVVQGYPDHRYVIRCIGQEAVNQAGKSLTKAKSQLSQRGIYFLLDVYFVEAPDRSGEGKVSVFCWEIILQKR